MLFGMYLQKNALENMAGDSWKRRLQTLTGGSLRAIATGMAATACIQSSSALTVMVIGLTDAGMMTLRQAAGVMIGANIGTTVTAWLLSLSDAAGASFFMAALMPAAAISGAVLLFGSKKTNRQFAGGALLGFSVLLFGMDLLTDAAAPLAASPRFCALLSSVSHPLAALTAGALFTGVVQSSSASVGILQSLCSGGLVTLYTAVPIVIGQNIGTCMTVLLASCGSGANARRAALFHLMFNCLGAVLFLPLFCVLRGILPDAVLGSRGVALIHTLFNVLCALTLTPFLSAICRLCTRLVPQRPHSAEGPYLRESAI